MKVLIDASAVLATILNETGAEVAHEAMSDGQISIVNWCEVLTKLVDSGVELTTAEQIIGAFELEVRPFQTVAAIEAARLRPLTRRQGLSFGDRACLADARLHGFAVVTAERRWAELDLGIDIRLIR